MLIIVGLWIYGAIVQSREKISSSPEKHIQDSSVARSNIRTKVIMFSFEQASAYQEASIHRKQKVFSNGECPLVIEHCLTNKPKVL